MSTKNFENLITSLLQRGKLSKDMATKIYKENVAEYETAFTHRTYNPLNNYEYYEFLGDTIVNSCMALYIVKWDTKIVSVKFLTRLKHNLASNKMLAHIAHQHGFFDFIKLGEGDIKNKKTKAMEYYKTIILQDEELRINPLRDEFYRGWLEDVFEAFIGLTSKILETSSKKEGISFPVCYAIVSSFLDELPISLKYEDLFDAKTRFKELCDKRWKFELKNDKDRKIGTCIKSKEWKDEEGKWHHETTVVGFPYGDKTAKKENEEVLAKVEDKNKMDSQNKACEIALKLLKEKFAIYDPDPDPYKKYN